MVNKGDLIKVNLGNGLKKYRVLEANKNNTKVKLLALYDIPYNQKMGASFKRKFEYTGQSVYQEYNNSNIDIILNTAFYDSLSAEARNALYPTMIFQEIIKRLFNFHG